MTTCVPISCCSSACARARRHRNGRCDENAAVDDHDAAAVVADLDAHRQIGLDAAIVLQLGFGPAGERSGIEARAGFGRWGVDMGKEDLGLGELGGRHGAVKLPAEVEEPRGAATAQHLELQLQLAVLGLEQVREGRVRHRGRAHVGQSGGELGRVVPQRLVPEDRRGPVLEEPLPGRDQVDRRDVEQKPDAGGHVRQLVVDGQILRTDRFHHAVCPAMNSATFRETPPRASRSSSRCSCSGTPVHSSMKIFLNSSANVHAVVG